MYQTDGEDVEHVGIKMFAGRPLIFKTMNSVWSNEQSIKYQRLAQLGRKNIGIRKLEFAWQVVGYFKD